MSHGEAKYTVPVALRIEPKLDRIIRLWALENGITVTEQIRDLLWRGVNPFRIFPFDASRIEPLVGTELAMLPWDRLPPRGFGPPRRFEGSFFGAD